METVNPFLLVDTNFVPLLQSVLPLLVLFRFNSG